MTIPRFEAMNREWRARPPVHWLVASFVGYKPKAEPAARETVRSLRADFRDGVIR